MASSLETILSKIELQHPAHAGKLKLNLNLSDEVYLRSANAFFDKYIAYLERNSISLDFGITCYLHMISDMLDERYKFIQSGNYSNTSFEEVEKKVYGNPEIMTYHMHGLVLAQFLWFDQYERILFFTSKLRKHIPKTKKYLEIGGGHGLYMNEAVRLIPEMEQFDLVDISQSSLQLARGIINNEKINYYLKNIFDFSDDETYDFVTMGEVLEHVEEPLKLLNKIVKLIGENGICYITTPINAPMIDHIYLFNNENEIREMLDSAGLKIVEEKIVISEKVSEKYAQKFKVPVMYAAFVKRK